MVGVPGRSKGCNTCRRRKKGCDQQTPVCSQCRALGLVCGGYERERIWINNSTAAASKGKSPPIYTVAVRESPPRRQPGSESPSAITLHSSFARTAREAQYFGLYCTSYLPRGRRAVSLDTTSPSLSPRAWILLLEKLFYADDALRHVVLALSASVLGAEKADTQLKLKGLQTYTESVRSIAVALKNPRRSSADGVLAAVKLSIFYEILFGLDGKQYEGMGRISQISGWSGHLDGQSALLQQRGPGAFTSGTAHQLFTEGRYELALMALSRRKPTFLSEPEWMTRPWATNDRTMRDKLVDALVKVPSYLEKLDQSRRTEDVDLSNRRREALIAECQETVEDLARWRREMGPAIDRFDYTAAAGLPLPVPSIDADFDLLHLSVMYWTTSMFLVSTWELALDEYIQPGVSPSMLTFQGRLTFIPEQVVPPPGVPRPDVSSRSYVYRIAHSMHLFFAPGTGAWGANAAILPLGLALRYLMVVETGTMGKERQMLSDCFVKPYMGTFVGRFLRNFQQDADGPMEEGPNFFAQAEAKSRRWWLQGVD